MIKKRTIKTCASGLLGAALLVALGGCGGATLNKETVAPLPYSDPTVQGIAPTAAAGNGNIQVFEETSGLVSADDQTAYVTAAVDSDSKAIPSVALSTSPSNPSIQTTPLGFAPGGQFYNSTGGGPLGKAVAPGASVVFRAAIAPGVDPATGTAPPINPSSVTLTSTDPQWTLGVLPMTFNVDTGGPAPNGTYVTGTNGTPTPFALPFTTTGLHSLVVSVADTRAVVHHTIFNVLVLAGADSAVVVQVSGPVGGATVTIDNPLPGTPATATSDPLTGVAILFAPAGSHTVTATSTDSHGVVTNYVAVDPASGNALAGGSVTLVAGQAFTSVDGMTPFKLAPPPAATSGTTPHIHHASR